MQKLVHTCVNHWKTAAAGAELVEGRLVFGPFDLSAILLEEFLRCGLRKVVNDINVKLTPDQLVNPLFASLASLVRPGL